MIQFLADNIDQMDLALDQLAIRDRNFDRFALMLIDNVMELTLHKHAQDKSAENNMWSSASTPPRNDAKAVASALGQHFEAKVKLARMTGMVSQQQAESILWLHSFRNTVYHKGLRHEGILHSLALFYFENACLVLASYSPRWWSGGRDRISHRAMKYLGKPRVLVGREMFKAAWERLREVGASMGGKLIADLHADIKKTIETVDGQVKFLAEASPTPMSRKQVILDSQAWALAFTDEGKTYAAQHRSPASTVGGYVAWLASNYPWPTKDDPVPSWRRRLESLEGEKDPHAALKKYCDFLKQTEDLRSRIEESHGRLHAHIEELSDRQRGT